MKYIVMQVTSIFGKDDEFHGVTVAELKNNRWQENQPPSIKGVRCHKLVLVVIAL